MQQRSFAGNLAYFSQRSICLATQPGFRWVFRTLDLDFRCLSEVHIDCSEWHFPMGRPLGDGPFRWGLLTATRKITEFYFEGYALNQLEKRVTWGRLGRRALDTHRRYMRNRVKTRFEHMYLRLRNFHRGTDLNILTPLTMQTRIVSIRKMNFDDDHQFSLLILNSVFTS